MFETTSPQTHGRELHALQILRALAALGVLLLHVSLYVDGKLKLAGLLPPMLWGAAGVDLFFVISGFIMVYSSAPLFGRKDAPPVFFARRLARIVPLYWAASGVLLVSLLMTGSDFAAANLSWPAIFASFAFMPYPRPDGLMMPLLHVGWTLNYEMFFYAVFALALLLPRRMAVAAVSAVLAAMVALNVFAGPFPPWFGFLSHPIILEFCFGMAIALAFVSGARLPRRVAIGLIALAAAGFVASSQWSNFTAWRVIEWGLPSAALVAGMLWLGELRLGIAGPALAFLGDASYSLYLLHTIVLLGLSRILPRLIEPASAPWLCVALMIAMPIAVAVAVYLLFERPITRLLQAKLRRRIATAAEPALSALVPAATTSRPA